MEEHRCHNILCMLGEFLDGEAQSHCCSQIEAHMGSCERCRIVIRTTRTTVQICRDNACEDLPDAVRVRIRQVVKEYLLQQNLIGDE
ncbi:MAG: hypothetical protein RDV48_17775 [Candidatus Eremiobacteraeota bacterium]|nr:hypothetical protein [Candidatus Eremiobacteraeota bacterium]